MTPRLRSLARKHARAQEALESVQGEFEQELINEARSGTRPALLYNIAGTAGYTKSQVKRILSQSGIDV
jgi:protein tyrosine phosphatase (PTP) superfamily phosphohydrolase (DUF442 family)